MSVLGVCLWWFGVPFGVRFGSLLAPFRGPFSESFPGGVWGASWGPRHQGVLDGGWGRMGGGSGEGEYTDARSAWLLGALKRSKILS